MTELIAMIHLTTKYLLASAMMSGCSVMFILRAMKTAKDRRDSKRIYQFLCRSFKDGQYRFRSSEAISIVTNLPVSRIGDLCSKHAHIERKEQERHTWRALPILAESHDAVRAHGRVAADENSPKRKPTGRHLNQYRS
jgi:hypothetical protein